MMHDELIKRLREVADEVDNDYDVDPYNAEQRCLVIEQAADAIEELADRNVGKWIKARGSWCTPGGDPVWECSECGKGMHVYGIEHGTYGSDVADGQWVACPNCGARMDESLEGEDDD